MDSVARHRHRRSRHDSALQSEGERNPRALRRKCCRPERRRVHPALRGDPLRRDAREVPQDQEIFTADIKLSLPTTRFYTLSLGRQELRRPRSGDRCRAVRHHPTQGNGSDEDLMSMVTHEIRTPLATVRFAQILLKGGIDNEKGSEFLEIINRQSNRLVNLVNDFLDITRIESGRQVITARQYRQAHSKCTRGPAGRREEHLAAIQTGPRRPLRGIRRPQSHRAGPHQPAIERHQVQPEGRFRRRRGRRAKRDRRGLGSGHRARHSERSATSTVREVLSPRRRPQRHHWNRSRAFAGEADHGSARGHDSRRVRARQRLHVHNHDSRLCRGHGTGGRTDGQSR